MDKPKISSKAAIIAIVLLFLIVTPLALSLLLPQRSMAVGAIRFYSVPINHWGFHSQTGPEFVYDPRYRNGDIFAHRRVYESRAIELGAFAVTIRGKQTVDIYK